MAAPKKSYWRTLPGILTEIAGVVTAFGALAGVAVQLGVVGDSSPNAPAQQSSLTGRPQAEGRSQPQADWARKANVICTRTIKSYKALPRKASIALLDKQVDIGWSKVRRIRDLAPPQGERPTYTKYVRAIAAQMEALEERFQLIKRYADAPVTEEFKRQYDPLQKRVEALNRRSDTLAVELGATVCAQEPY